MKLLVPFFTTVVAEQPSNGSCLIQKFNRATTLTTKTILNQHHEWRIHHMSLVGVVNQSKTLLDRFIDEQAASKSACSSRLLESKRVLDGLLKDVSTLNSQVVSKEEIMETETQNLKMSEMSIEAVKTMYKEMIERCRQLRKEAIEDYKKYRAELIELIQIAKPSLRYDHAVKVVSSDTNTSVKQMERLQKRTFVKGSAASLLQEDFDKQMCLAFVRFANKHNESVNDLVSEKGCDEQREELKKAFKKAYVDVTKLKKEARDRAMSVECFESAHVTMSAELVPLISQRDATVEKITIASEAIVALTPVMKLVKDKSEKLKIHIAETLTPECEEAGEASKLLVQVRKLILSLEKCPGRNDFKLEIPSKEEIAKAIKAMEEEAQKEAKKLQAEDLEDEGPGESDVPGEPTPEEEKADKETEAAQEEVKSLEKEKKAIEEETAKDAAEEATKAKEAGNTSASLASTNVMADATSIESAESPAEIGTPVQVQAASESSQIE
jgi:hypothetical protein